MFAPDEKQERLHQAVMLKIAIRMRQERRRGFEEIFREILSEMSLDEAEFRHYVNSHLRSLMATVKKSGC